MNKDISQYVALCDASHTGLRWVKRTGPRCKLGGPAFTTLEKHGYYRGGFGGRQYYAHQVVFFLLHGYCPAVIDHIDGNKLNNAGSNLRAATTATNAHNQVVAGFRKNKGAYQVVIQAAGRQFYLGRYATPEEAHAAYLTAKREHHPTASERCYV
jgi:hypothetical protein